MNTQFILISVIILNSCMAKQKLNTIDLHGYEISQIMPSIELDGSIKKYDTSILTVYYYNDQTLFKLPYYNVSINDSEIVSNNELRHHYFAFKRGEKYGFDYDIHRTSQKLKYPVDSILNETWIFRNDLFGVFRNGKVVRTSTFKSKDSIKNSFTILDKNNLEPIATCQIIYGNKMPLFNMSICKELDTLQNMKLTYLEFTADPTYIKKKGITQGSFHSEYQIKKIDIKDKSAFYKYFEMSSE